MKRISPLLFFATCLFASTNAAHAAKPNVLFIVCDDLGLGNVSGFGYQEPTCPTPQLEKMAGEGVKLTRFMVPMPYCAPSRASILTGRYPFSHKLVSNPTPDQGIDNYGLPAEEITIAEMLKPAGYDTYLVGKWHLGHVDGFYPWQQGFDEYYGILYSNDMRPVQLIEHKAVAEYPVDQAYLTRKYTRKSIDYMTRSARAGRPFFLMLAHAMPHKPLAASPAFYTPDTLGDLFADVVRELDASVGDLFASLKELGIDRNTLVIFTSDNGGSWGSNNGGLRGKKAQTWDGGLRVPFIAHWPGRIPTGIENSEMASSIDLLPTLARLTGAELPKTSLDGVDIWQMLTDATAPSPHLFLVGMKGATIRTIHTAKWKLHMKPPAQWKKPKTEPHMHKDRRGPDGKTIIAPEEQYTPWDFPGLTTGDYSRDRMLFDALNDPGEQHDLSKAFPEVVERLSAYHDALPTPDYEIPKGTHDLIMHQGGRLDFFSAGFEPRMDANE